MTYTDQKIDLVINKMTNAQYEQAKADGQINQNELYFVDTTPSTPSTLTLSGEYEDGTTFSFTLPRWG